MKKTKGIILAGGAGSRLYPLSKIYSKQLVAVYDKPMIYYPFSMLISVGINEILIISDENTLPFYEKLFGNGNDLGLEISYALQKEPNGIAEAFIIGEKFIGNDNVALILGDNIFYGNISFFTNAVKNNKIATIFAIYVKEPERYGVIEFDKDNNPISIIEKPKEFVSNFAVPGFYIYNKSVVEIAKKLKPSARNELEITDINQHYLTQGTIDVIKIKQGVAWLDCGTPESLLDASNLIASIEQRQGLKIACPEEAALNQNFLTIEKFKEYLNSIPNCDYKKYLENILKKYKDYENIK
ncbi:MAG: glucose-1-phosphate thymidylyltransferase RfbA [Ignavibacteria bacterium]|jgi:glucose-1-phosphate thymidylyltransferase|nr:glucose-1-phosphate thymidylyltransferase RfbA [Ignavibacteria bacterium]